MTDSNIATATAPAAPHMSQLREQLLATLADLRNRDQPMEPDRARAIAQVAGVLVDSAKVEVDYLKATGQGSAAFLEEPADSAVAHLGTTPAGHWEQGDIKRLPGGVTRHTTRG
jgi:hypothetical protein